MNKMKITVNFFNFQTDLRGTDFSYVVGETNDGERVLITHFTPGKGFSCERVMSIDDMARFDTIYCCYPNKARIYAGTMCGNVEVANKIVGDSEKPVHAKGKNNSITLKI